MPEACVIEEVGASTLWHQRLGHMSENGMKMLASNKIHPDPKNMVVDFSQPCVLGK